MKTRLSPGYLFLTLVLPSLLWWGAIHSRKILIEPRCMNHIEACDPNRLPAADRFGLGHEIGVADGYSFMTQNASGLLGFGVPVLWNGFLLASLQVTPATFAVALAEDLTLMAQGVSWNGLFTEISHAIAGRPRPFVYSNPAKRGVDPAHYTSFYSGHTSFSAVTQCMLILILLRRKAPLGLLLAFLGIGEGLIFSTAYFRIMAGRHFFTDVLCGGIAGTWMAAFVSYFSRVGTLKRT